VAALRLRLAVRPNYPETAPAAAAPTAAAVPAERSRTRPASPAAQSTKYVAAVKRVHQLTLRFHFAGAAVLAQRLFIEAHTQR
jgi:hypothetical protein